MYNALHTGVFYIATKETKLCISIGTDIDLMRRISEIVKKTSNMNFLLEACVINSGGPRDTSLQKICIALHTVFVDKYRFQRSAWNLVDS